MATAGKLAEQLSLYGRRAAPVKWFSRLNLSVRSGLTQVYRGPDNAPVPQYSTGMAFDERLQRALDSFAGQLQHDIALKVQAVSDALAEAARAELADAARSAEARERAAVPSQPEHPAERLVEALRSFDSVRSLSGVLDTLVRYAGLEAPRVGVLLVRGERFQKWRFDGLEAPVDEQGLLAAADTETGVVADVARTATVAVARVNNGDEAPRFAGLRAGQTCLAVPLVVGEQVVAVLYADAGADESGVLRPEPLEVLGRYAARSLEALTAIKAARWLTRADTHTESAESEVQPRGALDVDDDAAARSYARLLVSEIKLYHEREVLAGRRERDLATRLAGEIARARALYEQRVPAEIREKTDYVHDELVRTLAAGDASLIG